MKQSEIDAIKDILFEVKHHLENVGDERSERDNEMLKNCNIGFKALKTHVNNSRIIKNANQEREIILNNGVKYPFDLRCVRIDLDKKSKKEDKQHAVIYQTGRYYGRTGDKCYYISHDELFELEEKGMVSLS